MNRLLIAVLLFGLGLPGAHAASISAICAQDDLRMRFGKTLDGQTRRAVAEHQLLATAAATNKVRLKNISNAQAQGFTDLDVLCLLLKYNSEPLSPEDTNSYAGIQQTAGRAFRYTGTVKSIWDQGNGPMISVEGDQGFVAVATEAHEFFKPGDDVEVIGYWALSSVNRGRTLTHVLAGAAILAPGTPDRLMGAYLPSKRTASRAK